MKKVILYLLLFSVILIAPLIQNHHSQIDNSTDIVQHTAVIQAIVDGQPLPWILYIGELVVGYPLAGIIKLTGFDDRSVYIWFNFIALIGAAFSLFFVTRKLVGNKASWLSVPITMFCSVSILAMFTAGVVFNVVNMYVIFPWAVYFVVKWITQKRLYYWMLSVLMLGLFFIFHASGMYLPFAMAMFCGLAVLYRCKGKYASFKPIMILCLPMIAVGAVLAVKFLPMLEYMGGDIGMDYNAVSPFQFIRLDLGFVTTALLCLAVYGYIVTRKQLVVSIETKIFGLLLFCFVLPLSVGMFLNISASSARMALDSASLIALLVACLLGILLEKRGGWFKDIVTYGTIAGVCITLFSWLRSG
jgi:hypothetical protein